ncbi:phosphoenolpyruvate--protein phosphotransferase [Lachnoanaerobaculum umeaense]|uniref:Phosphoenolpyruvate-protein phosphotransferase n=1 Tax=Lachnoanaerobaculum umeaense TaxID=617123 RepID=A0A385PY49_9FIRM|nr:phosphoenolpyruvate--protein phosphotransferase [Lachnoanaerobaculum umeaense]AYA98912.1 phosphoenolpyruvate--protein phosphotransferase [Lachnoanaerobaculum umeaense]PZW92748.1 phosphotransferase system enzyme I (PtsI) [Lachnoanaerobaculum umeaense]
MKIYGVGAADGIGIGVARVVKEQSVEVIRKTVSDIEAEVSNFMEVLELTKAETEEMSQALEKNASAKEAEILFGHIMLMSDPMLVDEIVNRIKSESICAEYMIEEVCNQYAAVFASMDDELMQQRATDMLDIKTRLIKKILGMENTDLSKLPYGSILVAKDLTPSMTAGLNPENVLGIVTELGGKTSHSAILARALEIPAVVGLFDLPQDITEGTEILLDGENGEVIIMPTEDEKSDYDNKKKEYDAKKELLKRYKELPSISKDGKKVEIAGNIGSPEDAKKVILSGGEGIGLFRTEFLFMDRDGMPSEDEQFESYKEVAIAMEGKPVIIRTLDIGGDKEIPYMGIEQDENPFLGYRAIRLCLDRKNDIYIPQLRALLRASAFGNIKIMLPLITSMDEIKEAKALINDIKSEFDLNGIAYNKDIEVGIMVETAAASLLADIFAKEVDFFSIGTNDLIQYTMSVDRGNVKIAGLYSPFSPAVLRSINRIITEGKKAGIMVGMCGEAAADPLLIPVLLAWGLDEFSMSASSILKSRQIISLCDSKALLSKVDKVLEMATESEIKDYLKKIIEEIGC